MCLYWAPGSDWLMARHTHLQKSINSRDLEHSDIASRHWMRGQWLGLGLGLRLRFNAPGWFCYVRSCFGQFFLVLVTAKCL